MMNCIMSLSKEKGSVGSVNVCGRNRSQSLYGDTRHGAPLSRRSDSIHLLVVGSPRIRAIPWKTNDLIDTCPSDEACRIHAHHHEKSEEAGWVGDLKWGARVSRTNRSAVRGPQTQRGSPCLTRVVRVVNVVN